MAPTQGLFLPVANGLLLKLPGHEGKLLLLFFSEQWLLILVLVFPRWLSSSNEHINPRDRILVFLVLLLITSAVEHLVWARPCATCVTYTIPQQPCDAGNVILIYRWGTKAGSFSVKKVAKWDLNLGLTITLTLPRRLSCFVSKIWKELGAKFPLCPDFGRAKSLLCLGGFRHSPLHFGGPGSWLWNYVGFFFFFLIFVHWEHKYLSLSDWTIVYLTSHLLTDLDVFNFFLLQTML